MTTKSEWLSLLSRLSQSVARSHSLPAKVCADLKPALQHLIEQLPAAQAAIQNGWRIFVVAQSRGRCNYSAKTLTVPKWAFTRPKGEGYALYYLAHEVAHAYAPGAGHGIPFMNKLMEICPPQFQHWEHGYKPRFAAAAGVPRTPDGKQTRPAMHLLSQELPKPMPDAARTLLRAQPHRKLPGKTLSVIDVITFLREEQRGKPTTIAETAAATGWQPVRIHGAFLALKAQGKITYANKTATPI